MKDLIQIKLDECRTRGIPFVLVQDLFKNFEKPKQWRSIPNILEYVPAEKLNTFLEEIEDFLNKQYSFNDKFLIIYDDYTYLDVLNDFLRKMDGQAFDLEGEYSFDKTIELDNNHTYMYRFMKTREVYTKEDIDLALFASNDQQELSQYDKIIGFKANEIHCFDSIIVNLNKKQLVIQLDLASLMKSSDFDKNIEFFIKIINTLIKNNIGKQYLIPKKTSAVNFYECMKNFYNNSEGAITELSFTTSKGVHHEKLKGQATDIRKADYHKGGKEKEKGQLYPYRVTKKFNVLPNYEPKIMVGVRYQYYNSVGEKFLGNARIIDTNDAKAYLFSIDKILSSTHKVTK